MTTALKTDNRLSLVFEALSNPTRLQITRLVAEAGTLYCGELLKRFELKQPTMSHHLHQLLKTQILIEHKDGLRCYYSVNKDLLLGLGLHILN